MNPMNAMRILFATAACVLAACGSMVVPAGDGGGGDVHGDTVVPDAGVVCRTSDGRTFHPGESFPLDCNTCACQANGEFACTGLACVDAEPPPCSSSSECSNGSLCIGPAGCGVLWHCQAVGGCTADESPFCNCHNVTVYGSSSCPPEPYQHTGPCEGIDAGMCFGAFLDPSGACRGPADQALPQECCAGMDAGVIDAGSGTVDCDWSHALCDSLPPPCPSGEVRSVGSSACWGACVPYSDCAPIPCDPASPGGCPTGLTCWTSSRTCGPYLR